MALIPAPPTPTMWIRFGASSVNGSAGTSGLLDQIGEPIGSIGSAQRARRLPHLDEPVGFGDQGRQLSVESRSVALRVGHEDRGADVDEGAGIAGLVIAR